LCDFCLGETIQIHILFLLSLLRQISVGNQNYFNEVLNPMNSVVIFLIKSLEGNFFGRAMGGSLSPLISSRRCTLVLHLTSHLLIPYCPSRVLRSSSFSNLLQVSTITLFSVPALFTQLRQLFGTLFPTHSIHPVHSTLLGGTSKHTFIKQLLIPLIIGVTLG